MNSIPTEKLIKILIGLLLFSTSVWSVRKFIKLKKMPEDIREILAAIMFSIIGLFLILNQFFKF